MVYIRDKLSLKILENILRCKMTKMEVEETMERLTEKCWMNLDPWEMCGQDHFCTRGCHDLGGCTGGCIVPKLYAHLGAYEDTDLTPEEIRELKGLWKVVCKLYGINTVGLSINNPLTLEKLREMDGEPVWDARWSVWGILDTGLCCVFTRKGDIDLNEALVERRLYRRRPEEKMQ